MVEQQQWFDAAMQLLGAEGFAALKLAPLCRAVGLTTGAFYHRFGSWAGFVEALLDDWDQQQTRRVAALSAVPTDPRARIATMKRLAVAVPHDAEAAIRAWASVDPAVAVVQQRVDRERLDALTEVIAGVVPDRRRARELAFTGLTLLVGVQQWHRPVPLREVRRVLDTFEALVVARSPALTAVPA